MNNCPKFLRVVNNTNSNRALFCRSKAEAAKLFYLFGETNSKENFDALWEYINNDKKSNFFEAIARKIDKKIWRTIEDITCCIVDFNFNSAYIIDADFEVDTEKKIVTRRKTIPDIHPPTVGPFSQDSMTFFLPGFFLADRLI